MRNFGVTVLSLLLTTAVIGNAYYQKKQFYPSVVYITKSNPSMAVMYIQAFSLVFLIGKLMRKVFFGELRAAEFEHLIERSWYAVTETCLAFTVFRDDFSPKFVALFTVLLFLKSFHWLAEDRVDFMERSPVISLLFHLRILTLLTILGMLDLHFVGHAYQSTLSKGASVQLVFGFEYAILLTITINIGIKYILHSIDLHSEIPWENKAIFLLYTELIMGVIKVFLYVMFVFIMVRIYTLPLFAFRPMYYTLRAFKKAFNDVILSRRAIRNMNTLYPDATPEELAAADNVCIICREDMRSASKKLPCNHIFHTACLRSWFQRQQTCPTCRLNILRSPGGAPQEPQVTPQPQGPAAPPPVQPQPPHRHHDNRPPPQPPFNFVFPWPPQQQRPPPGVPDGTTDAPGSSPGVSNMPRFPTPEGMPFFCPPFPFIPFNLPPPMPPTTGLSDAELRRMEARTREAVEARISCLQNVQRLLDASVLLMQQYCAAAATSNGFENEFSTSTIDETMNAGASSFQATFGSFNNEAAGVTNLNGASQPGPSGTDSPRFQTEERSSAFNSASSVVDSDKCSTSSVENDKQTSDMMQNEILKTRGSEDSLSSSPSRESVDSAAKTNQTTEQEEARKMRLAKFSQTK